MLAKDGQQAVNLFRNAKPGTYDAVLMDIRDALHEWIWCDPRNPEHGARGCREVFRS